MVGLGRCVRLSVGGQVWILVAGVVVAPRLRHGAGRQVTPGHERDGVSGYCLRDQGLIAHGLYSLWLVCVSELIPLYVNPSPLSICFSHITDFSQKHLVWCGLTARRTETPASRVEPHRQCAGSGQTATEAPVEAPPHRWPFLVGFGGGLRGLVLDCSGWGSPGPRTWGCSSGVDAPVWSRLAGKHG